LDINLLAATVALSTACTQLLKILYPQELLSRFSYFTPERQNMVLSIGGLAVAVLVTSTWSSGISDPLSLIVAWMSSKGLYHGAKSVVRTIG
jgi:hypothetical protein